MAPPSALRQHRQHRQHRSTTVRGIVAPGGATTADATDNADDADGDYCLPFSRYPPFCPFSRSVPTALERLCPKALILMIRAPDRPSRPNAISMSSMRRKVWARRSRPASARGFFAHGGLIEVSSRALSAHRRNRSDALPLQLVRSPMIVRTQVAKGSASIMLSMPARRLAA